MKSIVFFNNKGGVGKTTLACNVASYFQNINRVRTILIDADPQCNATQLYYDDKIIEDLFIKNEFSKNSLYYILRSIEDGESSINSNYSIVKHVESKYKTDVITGHPRLSMLEDRLSSAWSGLSSGDIGGARVTNWFSQLLSGIDGKYDIAIVDVGPSLGALNRSILLASDFFVSPLGCDIFSMLGIDNISLWIDDWSKTYDRSIGIIGQGKKRQAIVDYSLIVDTTKKFRLCGYTIQQYVTKTVKKSEKRAVGAYERIKAQIPNVIQEKLHQYIPRNIDENALELNSIPYLYSLIPMSQSFHCPIYKLTGKEGVVGSQYAQVSSYAEILGKFCDNLLANTRQQ